jgi:hypothetical protein
MYNDDRIHKIFKNILFINSIMNIEHLTNSCFLQIHNNTLNKIFDLIKILAKVNKTDEISKISEILLQLVTLFNNYLDNININNHNIIIKQLYDLYKNNIEEKDNLTDLIKKCIIMNIRELLVSIEDNCNDAIIESNSTIMYYLIYSIYKSIIILYSYEYYLKKITEYFSNDDMINDFNIFINYLTTNTEETSEEISEEELSKALDEILLDDMDNDKDISISDEVCKKEDEITVEILTKIYDNIIKKFIKEVIKSSSETLSINIINNIGTQFITRYPDKTNHRKALFEINKRKGSYHVLIIKTFLLLKKISVSNNIITIPQYIGICWYVSILTGMCYSDASRNLILSKITDLKTRRDLSHIEESEKHFINTVIYIIETITVPQLKYGDNIHEKCTIFKYLKEELPKFITLKKEEIFSKILSNPNQFLTIFKNNEGNDDYYFINKFKDTFKDELLEFVDSVELAEGKNPKKQQIKKFLTSIDNSHIDTSDTSLGISMHGFGILNMLYKILNINSLYLVKTTAGIYKKNDDIHKPDVIIIHKFSELANTIYAEEFEHSEVFKNKNNIIIDQIDSENFVFDGNNYKLDYILYTNASIDEVCNRTGCGHCISGINYHGKKYYYDSAYAEQKIKCDGDDIRIPCTLTRQDWNISNTEVSHFTINKCFYRDVDISNNDIRIEKDFIDESRSTFDNENVICVYVKVPNKKVAATSGGKNNTYKSTHKKVNIMNKNKTIIERIVYIDNNKNKFIKFNKKYESLSTFKYNRKNKYYYI